MMGEWWNGNNCLFQLNGRTLKCSLAIDNGRTREFLRKRQYPDKSKCFECGVSERLSMMAGEIVYCNLGIRSFELCMSEKFIRKSNTTCEKTKENKKEKR